MTNRIAEKGKDKGHSQSQLTPRMVSTAYSEMDIRLAMQPTSRQVIYRQRLGDPGSKSTLRSLAAQLGISAERVRQVENSLMTGLRNLAVAREGAPIAILAAALAREAGALIPETELTNLLKPQGTTSCHALAILHLAGAYRRKNGWYHLKDKERDNPTNQIKKEVAKRHRMSIAEATTILVDWGMNPSYVDQWLDSQTSAKRQEDFLFTSNYNLTGQAYAVLHRLGRPAALPEIARLICYKGSTKKLQNYMGQRGSFSKCTRDKYGLKEWGLPRYESMPKAMKEMLTEHRGTMLLEHLQESLYQKFEVPPERTTAWAHLTQGISLQDGHVRLGPSPNRSTKEIRLAVGKGLFRISDRQAAVVTDITAKILKGSDTRVSKTISRVMGLDTNRKYHFTLTDGATIRLSHYQNGHTPALGRLLRPLRAQGAREGDIATILLDLETSEAKVKVTKQEDVIPSWQTIAKLTGIKAATEREGLAQAMMCHPKEIEHMLRLRNDRTVLKALPEPFHRANEQEEKQPAPTAQMHE